MSNNPDRTEPKRTAIDNLQRAMAGLTAKELHQAQTDHDHLREIGRAIQQDTPNVTVNFEVLGDKHVRIVVAQRGSMLDTPRKNDDPIVLDRRSREDLTD